MPVNEKVCSTCLLSKDLDEFHRDSNRPDGRRSSCKACRSFKNAKEYPDLPVIAPPPEDQDERDSLAKAMALKEIVDKHYPEFKSRYVHWANIFNVPDTWIALGADVEVEAVSSPSIVKARVAAMKDVARNHAQEYKSAYWVEKDKLDLRHKWNTNRES